MNKEIYFKPVKNQKMKNFSKKNEIPFLNIFLKIGKLSGNFQEKKLDFLKKKNVFEIFPFFFQFFFQFFVNKFKNIFLVFLNVLKKIYVSF